MCSCDGSEHEQNGRKERAKKRKNASRHGSNHILLLVLERTVIASFRYVLDMKANICTFFSSLLQLITIQHEAYLWYHYILVLITSPGFSAAKKVVGMNCKKPQHAEKDEWLKKDEARVKAQEKQRCTWIKSEKVTKSAFYEIAKLLKPTGHRSLLSGRFFVSAAD